MECLLWVQSLSNTVHLSISRCIWYLVIKGFYCTCIHLKCLTLYELNSLEEVKSILLSFVLHSQYWYIKHVDWSPFCDRQGSFLHVQYPGGLVKWRARDTPSMSLNYLSHKAPAPAAKKLPMSHCLIWIFSVHMRYNHERLKDSTMLYDL